MDREDDTARLVYADWLDEQDRSEEAAYVRMEVHLRRAEELTPAAMADWADVHRTGWAAFRRSSTERIWEQVTGTCFEAPPPGLFRPE